MLTLNLEVLFRDKGIEKPIGWMMKQGISNDTAHKLLHGKFKRGVPMHHINMICEKLWCTPNDVFVWTPKTKPEDIATHPLQALRPRTDSKNIKDILKTLPPNKIEKLKKLAEEL